MNEDKKYSIIYADPPWRYRDATPNRKVENHYPTMALQDIKNIPVPSEKNSVLFLWATTGKLPECLEVMKAWGFKYITVAFCWSKNTVNGKKVSNLGRWTMGNVEVCLLGRKGKPQRISKNIKQLVEAERTTHSKKPQEVRERIVALMGDVPRIELFAREKTEGWDVWGNEVENDISLPEPRHCL